ncbi:hypothetical protein [Cupriavidus sp. D39]|uniref:hypothetical protein n=1 Tax=Cupriavidus sp. D39 TaxID=2997877 RepID=UPI0022703BD7|nr:hypothetical protein [Cupriavidus sp. D39]MCY0852556.1 hypothetical protein [Cupriavidus sp. D39]
MTGFPRAVPRELRTPNEIPREAEAASAREGMVYAGTDGLAMLQSHMRSLYRERMEGSGEGYGIEYFRGVLHGLAVAGAMTPHVSVAIHDFITARGYERASD